MYLLIVWSPAASRTAFESGYSHCPTGDMWGIIPVMRQAAQTWNPSRLFRLEGAGDAVQVFKYVHCGEVAPHNALYLCDAVVVFLERVTGEPSAECSLDLDDGPNCNFEVVLSKPAANKLQKVAKMWSAMQRVN